MNAPLPQPTTLGPDSLIWRYFGDRRVMLMLGAGFILQAAHPVIGKGVADHSTFKTDPHGRMQRSLALLWPVIYNTPEGVAEYGRKLREMHRPIKGTGFDGQPYHALNPAGYLWVHATGYNGMIKFAEFVGEPLDAAQQAQLFGEWLQMGRQLGLRDEDMPRSVAEYDAYVRDVVDHQLSRNETLDYLLCEEYFTSQPKPPSSRIPDWLWRPLGIVGGRIGWLCTRAAFPEEFRERFNVPLSRVDAFKFGLLRAVVNGIWPLLPERKRWLWPAWKAIRDARAHPEKYPALRTVTS